MLRKRSRWVPEETTALRRHKWFVIPQKPCAGARESEQHPKDAERVSDPAIQRCPDSSSANPLDGSGTRPGQADAIDLGG